MVLVLLAGVVLAVPAWGAGSYAQCADAEQRAWEAVPGVSELPLRPLLPGQFRDSDVAWYQLGRKWSARKSLGRARELLSMGDEAAALSVLERAVKRAPGVDVLEHDHCVAAFHADVALLELGGGGPFGSLSEAWLGTCGIPEGHSAALASWVSHVRVWEQLGSEGFSALDLASLPHSDAYGRSSLPADSRALLDCDTGVMLAGFASQQLADGQPERAVEALLRVPEYVEDWPCLSTSTVAARLTNASELLARGEPYLAIDEVHRALSHPPDAASCTMAPPDPEVVLLPAWLAAVEVELGARDETAAVHALSQATSLGADPRTLDELTARLELLRASEFARSGSWRDAQAALRRAESLDPSLSSKVGVQIAALSTLEDRVHAIADAASFLGGPDVLGEDLVDSDGDGVVDLALYFAGDTTRAVAQGGATTGSAPPDTLYLLDAEGGPTGVVLRDQDADGVLDERVVYRDGALWESITDVDADGRPDIHRRCSRSGGCVDTALSGVVGVVVESGAIRDDPDWFSPADGYVGIVHNGRVERYTDPDFDTNLPRWGQGVVVHYKYGDTFGLELYDWNPTMSERLCGWKWTFLGWTKLVDRCERDPMHSPLDDEWLGVYETRDLPKTGSIDIPMTQSSIFITVQPSTLPPGHFINSSLPPSFNVYRDDPASVPGGAMLKREAERLEARADIRRFAASTLVGELMTMGIDGWRGVLVGQALDWLVLDPMMRDGVYDEFIGY